MNVLVVGATGFMGREAVQQLLSAGMRVRVMARTPEKAADLQKLGAEVVQGDLIDPPSLSRACQGMDAVVSAAHSLLGSGKYSSAAVDDAGQRALIDAAKAAGVEHFVFTSVLGASSNSPIDFVQYKAAIEEYLQGCGMKYTILRPPAFMEWHAHIFLGKDILEKGKATILGKGEVLTNFMSAGDVAKFVVIALKNPRACNRILEIGGLDNISKNDLAKMYIRLSGREAKIGHLPPPMLRLMSVLLKPFQPGINRVMLMSYYNDRESQSFDARKILAEFPIDILCLEDFVKARILEWKAAAG
ncbi:MAG: SDR family oxidoreductase [Anaerolineales bacterium]|nr:SDR family oxidoreductase [Anaerolineales bacterium]